MYAAYAYGTVVKVFINNRNIKKYVEHETNII